MLNNNYLAQTAPWRLGDILLPTRHKLEYSRPVRQISGPSTNYTWRRFMLISTHGQLGGTDDDETCEWFALRGWNRVSFFPSLFSCCPCSCFLNLFWKRKEEPNWALASFFLLEFTSLPQTRIYENYLLRDLVMLHFRFLWHMATRQAAGSAWISMIIISSTFFMSEAEPVALEFARALDFSPEVIV